MSPPSLRSRIRNGTLAMLAVALATGALALPEVHKLGGAIRRTLYRNYVSIEASQHMHAALWALELAERDGRVSSVLPASKAEFLHWIDIEEHDITEVGESELAADIEQRGRNLFAKFADNSSSGRHDQDFTALHERIDKLVQINRDAMFRADSRSNRMSDRLTYEFAAALVLLLLFGTILSWTLARSISEPLDQLADRLRSFSLRGPSLRLGEQPLAELQVVASEFNKMAERLEQFEKLNVDRLIYEKSKTEAIIESLEDGVVLIDTDGIVTHINEVATLILGIEAKEALGCPFEDLSSNSPHYLSVRDALRTFGRTGTDQARTEVQLHFRGRDHSYILKPTPLQHAENNELGTLLILQDVTYLRDQDRARTNLVATLSHELRTPLTSLALSAQLLRREQSSFSAQHRELIDAIIEECVRMQQLTDNLLTLARGELASIALQRERLDLARIAEEVADRFAIQAREKQVALKKHIEALPYINGDSIKLSWVISNLIGNALRYTPCQGTIDVAARPVGAFVRLEVTDSGPGIAPELRNYIFERFAQYGGNGAEKGAAGLGLAIVKDIVQAHGGRISIESTPSQGSRFVVELPAARI